MSVYIFLRTDINRTTQGKNTLTENQTFSKKKKYNENQQTILKQTALIQRHLAGLQSD